MKVPLQPFRSNSASVDSASARSPFLEEVRSAHAWDSSPTSPASAAATWRSISAPPTRSSMSAAAASCCPSRRWSRSTRRTGEVHAVGIEAKRMLGRTPGTITRHPPAQGRRDRRLRRDGADAAPLHPEGAPEPLGAPARRRLRPVRRHRRREARRRGGVPERRRPPGLPDRGADGGRDRRRPAGRRADGQHGRRHRRRHLRGRGDLPRRHRRGRSRSASAATSSTRRSSITSRRSTSS